MSKRKLLYGVRLTVDQLKYLKTVGKPSEWIRQAVDEKKRRDEKDLRSK
jgi:hypothetical protein